MRKVISGSGRWLVGVIILLTIGILKAYMDPDLESHLRTAGPGEFIPVYVTLKAKIDSRTLFNEVKGMKKWERRAYVINRLKSFYHEAESPILSILRSEEEKDNVRDVRPLWITNVIAFKAKREVIESLEKDPRIEGIYLDEKRNMLLDYKKVSKEMPPDKTKDPASTKIKSIVWNVLKINADDVWALGYTGQGVVVAILDTGVNYNHVDLQDHMWTNNDEIPGNSVDDDGNGYVDDYYGYNFAYDTGNPMDDHGHGTHCAGTIAGDGTAGTQTGVAPDAMIMALKVLDNYGSGSESDVWEAIQYAVDNGAWVMSMSIGWQHAWSPNRSQWRSVIDNARTAGLIAAVAAGNERQTGDPAPDNIRTPGDVPPPWINPDQPTPWGGTSGVVTVGATDSDDDIASFSSYGPVTWEDVSPYNDWDYPPGLYDPDVSAPGVNITSLDYSNNTGYVSGWSGTSMAAPHVAGTMALMLQKNPNLTPEDIDQILETTAVDLGSTGKDNDYGAGRIDALAAVNAVSGGFNDDVGTYAILSPSGTVPAGQPLTPTAVVKNFGSNTESFYTYCEISEVGGSTVYTDYAYVSGLSSGDVDTLYFSNFTPSSGNYTVKVYTALSGDENPSNDTLTRFFTARLIGYDYLVWDLDPNHSSGPIVDTILMSLGYAGNYATSTAWSDSLPNYSTVWVFLGIFDQNYIMQNGSPEATALANYIQNGGKVYMEGGDCWYWDPNNEDGYDFGPLFGISGVEDGSGDLSQIVGETGTFTESMSFGYNGENSYIDHIEPTGSGFQIFHNTSPLYGCGVANDAGTWRTVGTSFELGGLVDGSTPSTKSELVARIMNFFMGTTAAPDIDVNPTSYEITMRTESTKDTILTISNTGNATLTFNINISYGSLLSHKSVNKVEEEAPKGAKERRGIPQIEGSGGPDPFGYVWIDSDESGGPTFNFVDITSVGTPLNLGDDDSAVISLPFSFPFYGISHTSVKISSNGYLTFGEDAADYTNDPIPNTSTPNDLIAPFWDDLNPAYSGDVYYYFDNVNNRFIVEWYDVPHYYSIGSYTFEVILYPDGRILYQYLNMEGTLDAATIGIENPDGSIGLQVVYNASYVHNNLAVLIEVPSLYNWLSVNPSSGSVDVGSSLDLTVTFNTEGLEEGTYDATIVINNNDPDENPVYIPVILDVVAYISGDVNGDEVVDQADFVYLGNYIFQGGPPPDPLLSGDVNGDCIVDQADFVYLGNYLFQGGPPPQYCESKVTKVRRGILKKSIK